jgi:hypothetical protein
MYFVTLFLNSVQELSYSVPQLDGVVASQVFPSPIGALVAFSSSIYAASSYELVCSCKEAYLYVVPLEVPFMKVRYFVVNGFMAMALMAFVFISPCRLVAQGRSNVEQLEAKSQHEPPMLGIHWAKGFIHATSSRHSPNMTWHGGEIMNSSAVTAIYWGTSWASSQSAPDKINGLDLFYVGFSGSNYAQTSDEYTGTNGQVGPNNTYGGHIIDTTQATGGNQVAPILAEVCKVISNPVSTGYYAVYTDLPRGSAGFCAWHSYGSCGSTPVQVAFFFNLDGDPGCDPQDTTTGNSQGLAALANVSAHELSEARTDPRNGGWYDRQGEENGDKCAWTFNVPSVAFTNGTNWKLQGEWSNAAYNAGTGYPNRSGQSGCLDGH